MSKIGAYGFLLFPFRSLTLFSLPLLPRDFDFLVVVVVVFSDIFKGLVFIFILLAWRVSFICAKTADEAKKKENHGREFHFLFVLLLLLILLLLLLYRTEHISRIVVFIAISCKFSLYINNVECTSIIFISSE